MSDFTLTPAQFVANLGEAGQGGLAHEPPTPAGGVVEWATAALEQLRAKHPDVGWGREERDDGAKVHAPPQRWCR